MKGFRSFIDRYALIIAMVIGVFGWRWFRHLGWLTSPLIFLMLFFTFCKINPLDLRLRRWHFIVLAVQLALVLGGLAIGYWLLAIGDWQLDIGIVLQGLVLCLIMPTATAAPIIAGKLGGSIQNLTTFSLVSNIATAVIVPAFFPLINTESGMEFLPAMWMILRRVSPMLLGPFIAAWLLRLSYEWYYQRKGTPRTFTLNARWASMPFYLWILLLIVLISQITYTLLTQEYSGWAILALCIGSLIVCLLQFVLGRWIGYHFPATSHGVDYQDILINPQAATYSIQQKSRITAGQAFGQKNTALGVWMAQMYLNPLSAIGPAAYIIWQNLLNSFQLWNAGRGIRNTSPTK